MHNKMKYSNRWVPYPEDYDLVLAAGEVRKTPGEIERGSLATVSEMINPCPTCLLTHWSGWKDKALRGFAKLCWFPLSSLFINLSLIQAVSLIISRSNINVGILLEPHSSVLYRKEKLYISQQCSVEVPV